jgi:hypothetical protein
LKKYLLFAILSVGVQFAKAQTIDSLFFNLYTDSLKKGTHNYISIDAKYSNGKYLPLDEKILEFSSTAGSFERNSLYIPFDIKEEKITITVTLKSNNAITKSVTLYIKKKPDDELLPTAEQVMGDIKRKATTTKKKGKSKN